MKKKKVLDFGFLTPPAELNLTQVGGSAQETKIFN